MFKVTVSLILVILSYIIFLFLSAYDNNLHMEFYGYEVNISVWIFILGILLFNVLLSNIIFGIKYILNLPTLIKSKLYDSFHTKENERILEALYLLFTNNKDKARYIFNKLGKKVEEANNKYFQLLSFHFSNNDEDKILALKQIEPVNSFVYQNLALITSKNNNLTSALEYINKALDMDNDNIEALKIALDIYMQLREWEKADFIIEKLINLSKDHIDNVSIAYREAAEYYNEHNNYKYALSYLSKALNYYPIDVKALKLYQKLEEPGYINKLEEAIDYLVSYKNLIKNFKDKWKEITGLYREVQNIDEPLLLEKLEQKDVPTDLIRLTSK